MACYVAEEEAWKCPKHPSKSRRNGVCPTCLRDRLGSLCPVCANVRPCGCVSNTTSSASSSSSSSFSFFNNGGEISRASNFSDGPEPSFRRSRSVAIPFIRSASRRISTPSFLRKIATKKTKEIYEFDHLGIDDDSRNRIKEFARVVTRSRSVSTGTSKAVIAPGVTSSPAKWKLWHIPSPMKVFRSSKTSKVTVQDQSPMHRG